MQILLRKLIFNFSKFFGKVSSSYSTNINPFAKLTAVSILSASLFPKEEFRTIRSTKIEISCFIFLLIQEHFQYHIMFHQF